MGGTVAAVANCTANAVATVPCKCAATGTPTTTDTVKNQYCKSPATKVTAACTHGAQTVATNGCMCGNKYAAQYSRCLYKLATCKSVDGSADNLCDTTSVQAECIKSTDADGRKCVFTAQVGPTVEAVAACTADAIATKPCKCVHATNVDVQVGQYCKSGTPKTKVTNACGNTDGTANNSAQCLCGTVYNAAGNT